LPKADNEDLDLDYKRSPGALNKNLLILATVKRPTIIAFIAACDAKAFSDTQGRISLMRDPRLIHL